MNSITPKLLITKCEKNSSTGNYVHLCRKHSIIIITTMVKTRKGRQTNHSKGKTSASSPRATRIRESAKAKDQQVEAIDITTLADDDPTQSLRNRVRGFLSLMGDDSSVEDDTGVPTSNTPRKGEDKKRQRFAKEFEVIEADKDDSTSSSIEGPPVPLRLTERMEVESISSGHSVTIADILGAGPEETIELPEPLIITKDCRYSCQVKVPPCDSPIQHVAEKVINFMKWAQDKVGKEL